MNLLPKLYHHGSFEDLEAVGKAILSRGFEEVYLLGFSLGGVQILSYFGKMEIDIRVKAGVAVSTPIELKSSEEKIDRGFSRIYSWQLVRRLKKKINLFIWKLRNTVVIVHFLFLAPVLPIRKNAH